MHEGLPVESTERNPLFEHRAGQNLDTYLAVLEQPPTKPLTDEEKHEVVRFENNLLSAYYADGPEEIISHSLLGESIADVLNHTGYTSEKFEFRLNFIENSPEVARLCEENNISVDSSPAAKMSALATACKLGELKDLQKKSNDVFTQQVKEYLSGENQRPSTERIVVFRDATKLFQRFSGLMQYKQFLASVSAKLKESQDGGVIVEAKRAVLSVYMKRINEALATVMPDLIEFWQQANNLDEPQKSLYVDALTHMWSLFEHVDFSDDSNAKSRIIMRLDHIRNGATIGENGSVNVIADELKSLFYDAQQDPETTEETPALLSHEQQRQMGEIYFDANQMADFCSQLLAQFGKLSEEPNSTYIPDRPQRAHDGKWQVVIKDDISAMGAEDPEGVLEIPLNYNRNLTDINPPVGTISGAAHEVTHVFQKDNIRNNPFGLAIGRQLQGKGSVVLLEAGAIYVEKQVQKALFGKVRSENPHYMRAMQTYEETGDELASIRDFYTSYKMQNPTASEDEAVNIAISRVKRLTRRKGGFDSQALNYAETALIARKLEQCSAHVRDSLLSEGSFSIQDSALLHQYGLLSSEPVNFPVDEYIEFIVQFVATLGISKE